MTKTDTAMFVGFAVAETVGIMSYGTDPGYWAFNAFLLVLGGGYWLYGKSKRYW